MSGSPCWNFWVCLAWYMSFYHRLSRLSSLNVARSEPSEHWDGQTSYHCSLRWRLSPSYWDSEHLWLWTMLSIVFSSHYMTARSWSTFCQALCTASTVSLYFVSKMGAAHLPNPSWITLQNWSCSRCSYRYHLVTLQSSALILTIAFRWLYLVAWECSSSSWPCKRIYYHSYVKTENWCSRKFFSNVHCSVELNDCLSLE